MKVSFSIRGTTYKSEASVNSYDDYKTQRDEVEKTELRMRAQSDLVEPLEIVETIQSEQDVITLNGYYSQYIKELKD